MKVFVLRGQLMSIDGVTQLWVQPDDKHGSLEALHAPSGQVLNSGSISVIDSSGGGLKWSSLTIEERNQILDIFERAVKR